MKKLLFAALIAVLFASCQKDELAKPEYIGVCDMAWNCDWSYNQFITRYGEPDSMTIDTIHAGGQLEIVDVWAYWTCYRPEQTDGGMVNAPVAYLTAQFQKWNLVSWVILEL